MDAVQRVNTQRQLTENFGKALKSAGMSPEGVTLNMALMTMAVVLENTTSDRPGVDKIVTQAIELVSQAIITYQKKYEPNINLTVIDRAAQEVNRRLDDVYESDD